VNVSGELQHSYRHCRSVARTRARNFYYGFWLLPRERRDAFCAVYAFMRICDDVADGGADAAQKRAMLQGIHESLDRALQGNYGHSRVLPALHDAMNRYEIPAEYLHELIRGTEMDLSIRSYATFGDLRQYCYRVASVVGLCSLQMLGFEDPNAKTLAEQCGLAFQLTNILRDVREDVTAGRIYLPLEDLERFRYSAQQLAEGVRNQAFADLMRFEVARARTYYDEAAGLIPLVAPESRAALWALMSIYRGILGRIERGGSDVLSRRAALSNLEKIMLVLRAEGMRLQLSIGGEPDWRLPA
jgi:phytoene synthase